MSWISLALLFLDTLHHRAEASSLIPREKCETKKNAAWHYEWCNENSILQSQLWMNRDEDRGHDQSYSLGKYNSLQTENKRREYAHLSEHPYLHLNTQLVDVYTDGTPCVPLPSTREEAKSRSSIIYFKCCSFRSFDTYIESVTEASICEYRFIICTPNACKHPPLPVVTNQPISSTASSSVSNSKGSSTPSTSKTIKDHEPAAKKRPEKKDALTDMAQLSNEEREALAEEVKEMFYHGYNHYMNIAYPRGTLDPVNCRGDSFSLGKVPMLTLFDNLDTLVIFKDWTEFRRVVALITTSTKDFNIDVNISVFEITIRVLGGLLSAHEFATDRDLNIYEDRSYRNELLHLAIDLGNRLLPAFKTKTGIPYGTVNLRHGVPKRETPIASLAGAGSLTLEFTILSHYSQDPVYAQVARNASMAIFRRQSKWGLFGKHLDTRTGRWTESLSGIGSNSDSFHEYLLKMYLLFDDEVSHEMFQSTYSSVMAMNHFGQWYLDIHMNEATCPKNYIFENLVSFWPGLQVLSGQDFLAARETLNAIYHIVLEFDFFPETFDVHKWAPISRVYPLRPEMIESTYYLFHATNDHSWLHAGKLALRNIQRYTATTCGHATVKDVFTKTLEPEMPSFFLSETCKYLYLLFTPEHFVTRENYVFTTEAHPFRTKPLSRPWQDKKDLPLKKPKQMIGTQCQCPEFKFWQDLGYVRQYDARYIPDTSSSRCTGTSLPELMHKSQQKIELVSLLNAYTRGPAGQELGQIDITQLDHGFRLEHIDSSTWYEVTHVDSPKVLLESGIIVTEEDEDEENQSTFRMLEHIRLLETKTGQIHTCSIHLNFRQNELHNNDHDDTPIPCVFSLFDISQTHKKASSMFLKGKLVRMIPRDGCIPKDLIEDPENNDIRGKIVIIDRGQCFFEDKVRHAQSRGATGVIIVNTEPSLDGQEEQPHVVLMSSSGSEVSKEMGPIKIPVVMVSYQLDESLVDQVIDHGHEIELIHAIKNPISTIDDLLSLEYPVLHGQGNILIVLHSLEWGIKAELVQGPNVKEWQISVFVIRGKKESEPSDVIPLV